LNAVSQRDSIEPSKEEEDLDATAAEELLPGTLFD